MRSLDRLHVEVQGAGIRVCTDRCITTVGQGARLTVAEAGDIVLVAAEGLSFCCPVAVSFEDAPLEGNLLEFERAKLLVYNLPDNFV